MTSTIYRIAIVGGGCSGVLTAINLLRTSAEKPLHITLIEKSPQIARGLAYAVPSDRCKLNVPVSGMSAFSNDPENFLRWMRSREPTVAAEEFVSRRFYGEYLAELLETHRQASRHHVLLLRKSIAFLRVCPKLLSSGGLVSFAE